MKRQHMIAGAIVNVMVVFGLIAALDYLGIIPWGSRPAAAAALLVTISLIVSVAVSLGVVAADMR